MNSASFGDNMDSKAAESMAASSLPDDLPASTYEMICKGAQIDPSAPALSFFLRTNDHRKPRRWTYGELVSDVTRTANMFTRLGVRHDSVIAYVLPNLPETHFVIWGGEAAGIVCAINPLLEPSAIESLLIAARAEVLVTLAPFPGTDIWPKVQDVLARVPTLRHVVLVDLADHVAGVRRVIASLLQKRESFRLNGLGGIRSAVPPRIAIHGFSAALGRESGTRLSSGRRFDAQDIASIFCTGGTTGLPKLAMRTHRNEVSNAWSVGHFTGDGMGPGKTVLCGLPLFHVNAVLATGLVPFSRGAHVILGTPQGYRGEGMIQRFWDIVEFHRINFFSGVPTLYATLLDVPIGERNVSSLEYGLCGAAPMPVEVLRKFQERTGVRILEGYGLTEGTCVSSANPPRDERRLGSIGLSMPAQQMKVVIIDDAGRYLRDGLPNEPGLLVIAGPNVFAGYAQPEHNEGLWIDLGDGQRWLNTGDMGRRDEDGYFWLTGRKKELIIRGGHNIDPAAIEEPLHRHPSIQVVAAVGRPDAHAGEVPVAYVQLKEGASASEQELVAYAREVISERAALPRRIRIVEAIPLTAVGKIFKPQLKQLEIRDAIESALAEAGIDGALVSLANAAASSLEIVLPDQRSHARAIEVLGHFPFRFSVRCKPSNELVKPQ
jgi:fatty-acyl-CoA synthase